jgi:hypothetical protein
MSKFSELQHGRYRVRVGPLDGRYAAQAFFGTQRVGEREQADTPEVAIERVRETLDARDARVAAHRGPNGTPTSLEYAEAFGRLGTLPASYQAMLEAHLVAPGNRLTATQLAEAGGYENYNAANLHYGKLGQQLAEQLGYHPPTRPDGSVIWTGALATWTEWPNGEEREDGQFEWILRPQVVAALRQ